MPELDVQTMTSALRRLAADLVGPDSADDLVQDTWVQALSLKEQKPWSLKGFLFTALPGIAHKHRRSEHRRITRELVVARDEVHPSHLELQLSDVLRDLDEALSNSACPVCGTSHKGGAIPERNSPIPNRLRTPLGHFVLCDLCL